MARDLVCIFVNNPKLLWDEANSFENASKLITNANYDSFAKYKDENTYFNIQITTFVNHAYSFELYLKCLMTIDLGYFHEGHNLLMLFNFLSDDTKNEIINSHNSSIINRSITQPIPENGDFVKSLTEGAKAFVDFRYWADKPTMKEEYDLSSAILYVKKSILKRCPEFADH